MTDEQCHKWDDVAAYKVRRLSIHQTDNLVSC